MPARLLVKIGCVQILGNRLFLSLVAYYNRDQFTMQGVDSLQSWKIA